jgi:hypothetical protein
LLLTGVYLTSCGPKDEVKPDDSANKTTDSIPKFSTIPDTLSKIKIYKGAVQDLKPISWFVEFECYNNSFNDSCEKQDLIYIPKGTKLKAPTVGNGLPTFPSGTILTKTFYYWKDKRNYSLGKQLVETRVLYYNGKEWSGKTFAWNTEQSDAFFVKGGKSIPVSWINEVGKSYNFNFKIASAIQCSECHVHIDHGEFLPIHFQIKNLNMIRPWEPKINQLDYFVQQGIMEPLNVASFSFVPNFNDETQTLEKRARGYLDTNCAHCHCPEGFAYEYTDLNLKFEVPIEETGILNRKAVLISRMRSTDPKIRMPKIHTTLTDFKNIDLVEKYLNTLT